MKSGFATLLNCMDGRVQLQANEAVRNHFEADFVDTITEAGIVKIMSDLTASNAALAAIESIGISLDAHESKGIAIAAHDGCAGNPVDDQLQREQLQRAVVFIENRFPGRPVIGLWVDVKSGQVDIVVD